MAKRKKATKKRTNAHKPITYIVSFIVWLSGVLVFLAVGFGMIGEGGQSLLRVPYIPTILTIIAGWVVVILTLLGVVFKLIEIASR